jgi:hypothetical protein
MATQNLTSPAATLHVSLPAFNVEISAGCDGRDIRPFAMDLVRVVGLTLSSDQAEQEKHFAAADVASLVMTLNTALSVFAAADELDERRLVDAAG